MVRAIVGTLLWVGRGKIDVAEFGEIVRSKDRSTAGPSAPARGLCLTKVSYDGRIRVESNESEELQ
jgi:tRNA pseudouridine38-40 synthase